MSVPMMPHRFVDGSTLDVEKINDNLDAGARDVNRNLGKRYTYSTMMWDLSGLTDASAEVLRAFAIRRPGASNTVEVVGVELVIYTATAVTWTVTCAHNGTTDATWPALTLLTTASATTESLAESKNGVAIPSSSTDTTFTLSASAASTITNGYLVIHLRCDRGDQGASHAGYTPTLLDSSSSTAGSVVDTELTALAAAVTNDTNNDKDLRCECFVLRAVASGASYVFRCPSGARRILRVQGYIVDATGDVDVDLAGDITVISFNVIGGGATTRVAGGADAGADATQDNDPMDATDDLTVTFTVNTATVDLVYALVWWS